MPPLAVEKSEESRRLNGPAVPSNGKPMSGLLQDHLDLAALEWVFEIQEGRRRFLSLGLGAVLLFTSFIYLQFPLVGWLITRGWSWERVGSVMGGIYFVSGALVVWFLGRRRKGVGPPFHVSLIELTRSLHWIEKRFL